MKKLTLLFLALTLFSNFSFSQNKSGHFAFTQSESAGNGPTADGKGYEFNFNNGSYSNCSADLYTDPLLNRADQFFAAHNTISFDSINGYALLKTNTIPPYRYFSNLIKDNCQFLSEGIDLSDPSNLFIEIKFKSNTPIVNFKTSFCYSSSTGYLYPIGYHSSNSNSINAEEWSTLVYDFSNLTSSPYIKEVVGFSYEFSTNLPFDYDYINNPIIITIDYIKIGSAVNSASNVKADGFTIDNLNKVNCGRFFNVLNNPNFTYTYDSTTATTEVQQLDPSADNQYLASIFTNQHCFFSYVDFSNPSTQLVNISIMPEFDIPYFSVDLNGYTTDGIWDVGKVTEYVSLKKGVWNEVTLPLNLETPNNTILDPKRITGYGLLFDSIRTSTSKIAANGPANTFKIKEVMIGSTAKTDYSSSTTSIHPIKKNDKTIKIYPNPGSGSIQLDAPFDTGNITILNSLGTEVTRYYQFNTKDILNLQLEKGVYLLMIESENTTYTSKLIIQ